MQLLADIDPDEVSPVQRGAQGRRFAFAKADNELDPALMSALEAPHATEGALVDELRKAAVDEDGQKAAVAVVRLLKAFELDVDLVTKAMAPVDKDDDGDDDEGDDDVDKDDPEFRAAGADVSKTADELGATREEQQMSETAAPAVPILKADGSWDLSGVPDEARGFYESVLKAADTAKAENDVLKERVEKAESVAAEASATLREREFVAKAGTEFDKIAPAEELGQVLKAASEHLDPEVFEKLEGILKGANERVAKGDLFAEVGARVMRGEKPASAAGVQDHSTGDAWGKIEKAASEIVEKSDGITQEQAIARVLKTAEGQALYAEYMGEYYGGVA
jgi:hypothetical protein